MVIENAMVMLKMAVTNWWTFAHQEKTIRDTAKGSLLSSHKLFSLLYSHGIKAKNCTNYSKCRPNICAFKICTVVQMRREATFCVFVYLHIWVHGKRDSCQNEKRGQVMWRLHKLPSKVSASPKVAKTLGLLDVMKYSTQMYFLQNTLHLQICS